MILDSGTWIDVMHLFQFIKKGHDYLMIGLLFIQHPSPEEISNSVLNERKDKIKSCGNQNQSRIWVRNE